MKPVYRYLLLSCCAFLLFCCSELLKSDKTPVRIEFSDCTGCLECIDQCPHDAFRWDDTTKTVYIDQERCTRCMQCIDDNICPEAAITRTVDDIPPAEITDLQTTSTAPGELEVRFTAPGDDGFEGTVHTYDIRFYDADNHQISGVQSDLPLPQPGGETEVRHFAGLPEDSEVEIGIKALDECENASGFTNWDAFVAGQDTDFVPPGPITDLTAQSGEDGVLLSWTAPGDDAQEGTAQSYQIRYAVAAITSETWDAATVIPCELSPQTAGSPESYLVQDLPLDQEFFFSVRATDEAGFTGEVSNPASGSIIPDTTPPAMISDLEIVSVSHQGIVLGWTAVGDDGTSGTADRYEIKVSTQAIYSGNWDDLPLIPDAPVPQPAGAPETFLVTGLDAQTHYYAAVRAVDNYNNPGPVSNIAEAETEATPDTTPPAQVTDLSAQASGESILLQWTSTGDDGNTGTAYACRIAQANQPIDGDNWDNATLLPDPPAPLPPGSTQEFEVTGLDAGTEYWFAIRILDESDNLSPVSNTVQAQLVADTTPPAMITDLTATAFPAMVQLAWTAPGDDGNSGTADHYEIRYAISPINEGNWQNATLATGIPEPLPAGTPQECPVTTLSPGIEYYFAIRAWDEQDNIAPISNVVNESLGADDIPPAPITNLSVLSGWCGTYNNPRIGIAWAAPGDDGTTGTADHYEIRYATNPINEGNWQQATLVTGPPAPASPGTQQNDYVTGLEPGVAYWFAIRTYDDAGNLSPVSNCPAGRLRHQIDTGPCNGCGRCWLHCPEDAITIQGNNAFIDYDACSNCGDCYVWCNRGAVKLMVIAL